MEGPNTGTLKTEYYPATRCISVGVMEIIRMPKMTRDQLLAELARQIAEDGLDGKATLTSAQGAADKDMEAKQAKAFPAIAQALRLFLGDIKASKGDNTKLAGALASHANAGEFTVSTPCTIDIRWSDTVDVEVSKLKRRSGLGATTNGVLSNKPPKWNLTNEQCPTGIIWQGNTISATASKASADLGKLFGISIPGKDATEAQKQAWTKLSQGLRYYRILEAAQTKGVEVGNGTINTVGAMATIGGKQVLLTTWLKENLVTLTAAQKAIETA
jgi:hypothetical protein